MNQEMSTHLFSLLNYSLSFLTCENPCDVVENILRDPDYATILKAKSELMVTLFTKEGVMSRLFV